MSLHKCRGHGRSVGRLAGPPRRVPSKGRPCVTPLCPSALPCSTPCPSYSPAQAHLLTHQHPLPIIVPTGISAAAGGGEKSSLESDTAGLGPGQPVPAKGTCAKQTASLGIKFPPVKSDGQPTSGDHGITTSTPSVRRGLHSPNRELSPLTPFPLCLIPGLGSAARNHRSLSSEISMFPHQTTPPPPALRTGPAKQTGGPSRLSGLLLNHKEVLPTQMGYLACGKVPACHFSEARNSRKPGLHLS